MADSDREYNERGELSPGQAARIRRTLRRELLFIGAVPALGLAVAALASLVVGDRGVIFLIALVAVVFLGLVSLPILFLVYRRRFSEVGRARVMRAAGVWTAKQEYNPGLQRHSISYKIGDTSLAPSVSMLRAGVPKADQQYVVYYLEKTSTIIAYHEVETA